MYTPLDMWVGISFTMGDNKLLNRSLELRQSWWVNSGNSTFYNSEKGCRISCYVTEQDTNQPACTATQLPFLSALSDIYHPAMSKPIFCGHCWSVVGQLAQKIGRRLLMYEMLWVLLYNKLDLSLIKFIAKEDYGWRIMGIGIRRRRRRRPGWNHCGKRNYRGSRNHSIRRNWWPDVIAVLLWVLCSTVIAVWKRAPD
jgi:hypothetical protein